MILATNLWNKQLTSDIKIISSQNFKEIYANLGGKRVRFHFDSEYTSYLDTVSTTPIEWV